MHSTTNALNHNASQRQTHHYIQLRSCRTRTRHHLCTYMFKSNNIANTHNQILLRNHTASTIGAMRKCFASQHRASHKIFTNTHTHAMNLKLKKSFVNYTMILFSQTQIQQLHWGCQPQHVDIMYHMLCYLRLWLAEPHT